METTTTSRKTNSTTILRLNTTSINESIFRLRNTTILSNNNRVLKNSTTRNSLTITNNTTRNKTIRIQRLSTTVINNRTNNLYQGTIRHSTIINNTSNSNYRHLTKCLRHRNTTTNILTLSRRKDIKLLNLNRNRNTTHRHRIMRLKTFGNMTQNMNMVNTSIISINNLRGSHDTTILRRSNISTNQYIVTNTMDNREYHHTTRRHDHHSDYRGDRGGLFRGRGLLSRWGE